jgi:hypothetical protein
MKTYLFIVGAVLLAASPALAQFPGITLPGGEPGAGTLTPLPPVPWDSPPGAVNDFVTENNSDVSATSETQNGMTGGFDPALELQGDLEQEVASALGLPLEIDPIAMQYGILWPGYANATYNQTYAPGSPEGDWRTVLGTEKGALEAGANQQATQPAELARLQALEAENAAATGVLQVLEVSNEVALFEGEQEMKLRNATNAQLNAINVAESNRQNQEAQDDLESLAVASSVKYDWDLTDQPEEPVMPNPTLAQ